jgi:signal transduction histidine kinase
MRLVTKINLTLFAVVAVSAVVNFGALRMTVMPSFAALEEQAADQNQSRVIEAIELQKEQVANSAGDYAIWDDTYDFMNGNGEGYEEKNVTSESLKTLGVDYFAALGTDGKVVLDKGFDRDSEAPRVLKLFQADHVPLDNMLVAQQDEIQVQSTLMRTDEGLVVVGFAPILRSDRSGERAGTLVLGRLLDIEAIKTTTKVNFDLIGAGEAGSSADVADDAFLVRVSNLVGLDADPMATLVSHTPRDITAVGKRTVLTTLLFLLGAGALILLALGVVLRKIAVRRIENLRSHLSKVAVTGKLETLPEDGKGDELSDALRSFNEMARQLGELRDRLRKQDYEHGAADQAAGLLHNVRNAMSPVSALAWQLSRQGDTALQQNLAKAVDQLKDPDLPSERIVKLNQFVAMSAARLVADDAKRQDDLQAMVTMLRHIDDILKETDQSAQLERVLEVIDLKNSVREASQIVDRRGTVSFDLSQLDGAMVKGHKVPLDQVVANIMINAAEAVESTSKASGRIVVWSEEDVSAEGEVQVKLHIRDDGVGIEPDMIGRVFEKGFSTKPTGRRGLGLHWCANAINAMGGKISVESAGVGKGATFTIRLQAQQADKVAA